jgi:hypothetical protein
MRITLTPRLTYTLPRQGMVSFRMPSLVVHSSAAPTSWVLGRRPSASSSASTVWGLRG